MQFWIESKKENECASILLNAYHSLSKIIPFVSNKLPVKMQYVLRLKRGWSWLPPVFFQLETNRAAQAPQHCGRHLTYLESSIFFCRKVMSPLSPLFHNFKIMHVQELIK